MKRKLDIIIALCFVIAVSTVGLAGYHIGKSQSMERDYQSAMQRYNQDIATKQKVQYVDRIVAQTVVKEVPIIQTVTKEIQVPVEVVKEVPQLLREFSSLDELTTWVNKNKIPSIGAPHGAP